MKKVYKAWMKACLVFFMVISLIAPFNVRTAHASARSAVTLDNPIDHTVVQAGMLTLSGTYTDTYDIQLYINGTTQVAAVMEANPDDSNSGTWHYELDTSVYNGDVRINALGLNIDTRYGVWSHTVVLTVDNPQAGSPLVTISNPGDGETVHGTVPVKVTIDSPNQVKQVDVRVNHGSWQQAARTGNHYTWHWNTDGLSDQTVSIEARTIDDQGHIGRSSTTYTKIGKGTVEVFHMADQDRSMWIWEPETYQLLLNPNARSVLNAFAKDTATFGSDPVKTFYLAVGPYNGMDILEEDPGKLRNFISWAHDQGFAVQACISGGTTPPYFGAYEVYHDRAVGEVEGIINYNLASGVNEKFDGVNVDIEPYISPDFNNEYPSLQLQYLDGLQKMIDRIKAAGINLPFGPAIPKWYDSSASALNITWNGSTKSLAEHVLDISDYVSIMDYRDTADGSVGIIAGARDEISYAHSIGKNHAVVIGVETKDIANSGDPETITFQEEGRASMERELDKVYAAFGGSDAFGGIAMHHYDDLLHLPSYWGEGGTFWEPPADTQAPDLIAAAPTVKALNFQQIQVKFGMAFDNNWVDRYVVYRSTHSGFTPGPATVTGLARSLSYTDIGLLPDTTYYYRVAAVDLQGNLGPASPEASATTGSTALKPMILRGLNVTAGSGRAVASVQAVDQVTGAAIPGAAIEGRFHYAGGVYKGGTADEAGWLTLTSESIPDGQQVGFEPRRVTATGYYWAQAYDEPHITALYPRTGLDGLTVSAGTWDAPFAKNRTNYTVTVPAQQQSITVTPTASNAGSVIAVNGVETPSGTPSAAIALGEGETRISMTVTGKTGETDVYTLQVVRSAVVNNVFLPSEDTFVYENVAEAVYGSVDTLEVVDLPKAAGGGDRMAFMKFDLGTYTEPVQTAKLRFYVPTPLAKPMNLWVYGYDGDTWSEAKMNWNNRLGAGAQNVGFVRVDQAGWYSLDVTGFVQTQMATDRKATFRFMDPNTTSILVTINSRENAVNQPLLLINPSSDAVE
ncbi:CBM96 family carbohydrate-binding protein [Paenibacillus aestuarii]|uniref:DNRLRE domain-containing protein n=1 Tax=Paenibacillus aestuarii TaxID=516965 RepID=A0ABW0KD42_9BACL|nr:DNRLRE domain-containing protein [Paenibacillus aestuarii]